MYVRTFKDKEIRIQGRSDAADWVHVGMYMVVVGAAFVHVHAMDVCNLPG
jgi:hypothetical protein